MTDAIRRRRDRIGVCRTARWGQYESVTFADVRRPVLPLITTIPCRALDIGAGTGRDAAALAAMGHQVVAVEPVVAFRDRAARLHPSTRIEWVDDSLSDLAKLSGKGHFDLVLLTAVWMHLDPEQRQRGMTRVSGLLRGGGRGADASAGFLRSPRRDLDLARAFQGQLRGAGRCENSYRTVISTLRFRGSATSSSVGTTGSRSPRPAMVMRSRGMPSWTRSLRTRSARRRDSASL